MKMNDFSYSLTLELIILINEFQFLLLTNALSITSEKCFEIVL